ncbi:hypothetical protein BH11PSE3_BH11PSE3_39880 [soil metagenome]
MSDFGARRRHAASAPVQLSAAAPSALRLSALVIIRTGVVSLSRRTDTGEVEVSRLAPGDFFGEGGLFSGTGETETIRALTFTVVYEVAQAALAKLMKDRPSIADEICMTLSRRARAALSGTPDEHHAATAPSIAVLVSRIRELFEVPHG